MGKRKETMEDEWLLKRGNEVKTEGEVLGVKKFGNVGFIRMGIDQ